jgi:hypothetical protein
MQRHNRRNTHNHSNQLIHLRNRLKHRLHDALVVEVVTMVELPLSHDHVVTIAVIQFNNQVVV